MGRKKKLKLVEVPMIEENVATIEETVTETAVSQIEDKTYEIEALNQELDQVRKDLERAKLEYEQQQTEMKLAKVRRELDEQEIAIMNKQVTRGNESKAKEDALAKQKAFDDQMVTGKFMNVRHPGSSAKLTYCKYATDPVKWYTFEHNKVYTIPRGFVDQINEYYARVTYKQKLDNKIVDPDKPGTALDHEPIRHQLYAFVPVSF